MSRKRYLALLLLGLATSFGIVMLTNPVGDWCASYLAEINLDIMFVDILGHLTQVSYLAMFGLWTMFFLLLIRLASGIPFRPALPRLVLTALVLCLIVPAKLGIPYRFSGTQPTLVTESILFAEILFMDL